MRRRNGCAQLRNKTKTVHQENWDEMEVTVRAGAMWKDLRSMWGTQSVRLAGMLVMWGMHKRISKENLSVLLGC